jgi:methylsterol monooxygenase/4-alpha-methyl-delta7-sterol-4alpha-methyl oxidase
VTTGLGYHLLAKFTPVHYVTIIAWLTFRLFETCEGHSGYDWSWGQMSFIPWKLGPDYHDFHHSQNIGNYGSMLGFWDTIMKTNREYRKFKLKNK